MRTWITEATVNAEPAHVVNVLTDPEAARRWAPLTFDVEGLSGGRLKTGARPCVRGRVAGREVDFALDVHAADERGLRLSARGPVCFDVHYEIAPAARSSRVRAEVSVRGGRGFTGALAARASEALLAAGALTSVLARIADEAERLVPAA
jgi:Polyketide cyclase / dehydrase and lipid transport